MAHSSKDLLDLELKNSFSSNLESTLLVCKNNDLQQSQNSKPTPPDGKPFTSSVPKSHVKMAHSSKDLLDLELKNSSSSNLVQNLHFLSVKTTTYNSGKTKNPHPVMESPSLPLLPKATHCILVTSCCNGSKLFLSVSLPNKSLLQQPLKEMPTYSEERTIKVMSQICMRGI
ncbi:unnamed protein product [Camellia sinensis]